MLHLNAPLLNTNRATLGDTNLSGNGTTCWIPLFANDLRKFVRFGAVRAVVGHCASFIGVRESENVKKN